MSTSSTGGKKFAHSISLPQRDEFSAAIAKSWTELYSLDAEEVARFQLAGLRHRFEELMPCISFLKTTAEQAGILRIGSLEDAIPLLFDANAYKSYPMFLLERNRFDQLTSWLGGMTSLDLSGIDASRCTGIDDWLDTLESETPLEVFHSSGTTGKLSFLPKSSVELQSCFDLFLKSMEGFGNEYGVTLGGDGLRLPIIYPSIKYGRHVAQRTLAYMSQFVTPTPDQCYVMSTARLSADVMSLSGRIRVAQAKGELAKMKLDDHMRMALKQYMDATERRPEEMKNFFTNVSERLRGQRVFFMGQTSFVYPAAVAAGERGISKVFAPDSVGLTGGGAKGLVLPADWEQRVADFVGFSHWTIQYGMSEMVGQMPRCPAGHFHIPPWLIVYLFDPDGGAPMPRSGVRTGRLGYVDLVAQTYWGGMLSGDQVTVDFDGQCRCGRKGARIEDSVTRYSAAVSGDDKVTCSATIDNTDAALKALISI